MMLPPPRPEVLDGLTNHQKGTEYVRVELPVEFVLVIASLARFCNRGIYSSRARLARRRPP